LGRPVGPAPGQQRRGDPRHLVGQRDRDDLEWSPSEKLSEPGIFLRLLARTPQDRMGSDNKNTPEVLITLFRDRPELLFASGRILPRHDPDPGRKITTWGTLIINVTGSFLIGLFIGLIATKWNLPQAMRIFLIVGICGGYTTFSTFSLDGFYLMERGEAVAAGAYMIASVALCPWAL
jgi:protein CrcB